jgi:hypothetical protein
LIWLVVDIHIKGVADADAAIIKQLADTKGMTRNKYLARLIHQHARDYYVEGELNDLSELARQSSVVIQRNTDVINALLDSLGIERE